MIGQLHTDATVKRKMISTWNFGLRSMLPSTANLAMNISIFSKPYCSLWCNVGLRILVGFFSSETAKLCFLLTFMHSSCQSCQTTKWHFLNFSDGDHSVCRDNLNKFHVVSETRLNLSSGSIEMRNTQYLIFIHLLTTRFICLFDIEMKWGNV